RAERVAAALRKQARRPRPGAEGGGARRALVVLVLDLGLGQGRLVGDAPVHGLLPAVEEATPGDERQLPQLLSLVGEVERAVGLVPEGEASHSLPHRGLDPEVLQGVLTARREELVSRERAPVHLPLAQALLDPLLDWGAVILHPRGD